MDIVSWLIGLGAWFFVLAAFLAFAAVSSTVGMWRVLERLGEPGWGALVPFYGTWLFSSGAGMERNLAAGTVACQAVAFSIGIFGMEGPPAAVALLALLAFAVLFAVACDSARRRLGYGAWMTVIMVAVPFVGFPMAGFPGPRSARAEASARQMAKTRRKDAARRRAAAKAQPAERRPAEPRPRKARASAPAGDRREAARRAFYESLTASQQMEFDMLTTDAERSAYYKRTMAERSDG